jgi:hypothetical protein
MNERATTANNDDDDGSRTLLPPMFQSNELWCLKSQLTPTTKTSAFVRWKKTKAIPLLLL